MALGKTPEDEYKDGLITMGERLKDDRGLLFTNRSQKEVQQ